MLLQKSTVPSLLRVDVVDVEIPVCTCNQQSRELANPVGEGEG